MMETHEDFIAGRVGAKGFRVSAHCVQDISEHAIGARLFSLPGAGIGQHLENQQLRAVGGARCELGRREAEDGVGKPGKPGENAARPGARLVMFTAVCGDRRQRGLGREIVGIQLQSAQVARLCLAEGAQRDQRVAAIGVRKAQLGVRLDQSIDVVESLCGPVEALQAQGQGIAQAGCRSAPARPRAPAA